MEDNKEPQVEEFDATEAEIAQMFGSDEVEDGGTIPELPPGAVQVTQEELMATAFEIIGEQTVINRIKARRGQ